VLGAYDAKSAELALNLYRKVVKGRIDVVDCTTAETVKTVENAYRGRVWAVSAFPKTPGYFITAQKISTF
jgi:UDP-N-acetyl-D-mannosaminuronate dehydrogenase